MAKVVFSSLKTSGKSSGKTSGKSKKSAPETVGRKLVTARDGTKLTVYKVDADSRTFGEDISYVFRQSVARARREHKRLRDSAANEPGNGPLSVPAKG